MSLKILNLPSWFSTIGLLFLVGYSNADQFCTYYKGNDPTTLYRSCPNGCCSNQVRRENTTCCTASVMYTTSTFTLFGYSWWIIFLCVICLFTAISICIHYTKYLHILNHSKYFNARVDAELAFTISKSQLDIRPMDSTVTVEQNPPSYMNSVTPPPPYTSVHA